MGPIVGGNKPDTLSMFWEEDESSVRLKVPLASGTRQEDVMVGIHGGKLFIMSKVASSHSPSPSSASSRILSRFSFLKKKEETGDICSLNRPNDGKILMNFNLPVGLDPDGFHTMDDAGVLTLTFKRLELILSSAVLERALDLEDVTMGWDAKDSKKGVDDFKAYLAAGTKIEDLMLGIQRGKDLIIGMLQKKEQEGDTRLIRQYDGNSATTLGASRCQMLWTPLASVLQWMMLGF